MSNLQENVNALKQSPLFALSLGGKELSHSNFWEWLINIRVDSVNPFVEVFYPEFYSKKNQFIKVEREKGHRDLTIYFEDFNGRRKAVFIENKLKAIPTIEQLRTYEENFSEKNIVFEFGILTGIEQTLHYDNWEFLSYAKIAERIAGINQIVTLDSHIFNTIENYVSDIQLISCILLEKLNEAQNRYFFESDSELEKLRLEDIYLKFSGSKLSQFIEKELNVEFQTPWGMPVIGNFFNNKKPTVDIMYKQKVNDEIIGVIGIQIEGKQFRLHSGPVSHYSRFDDKDYYFNEMKRVGFLENYDKSSKLIREKKTSLSKLYGSYTGKIKNNFQIYQYWNIRNGITYDELIDEIKTELLKVKNIIQDGFTFE